MNYINSLFNNYETLKKVNYENIQEIIKVVIIIILLIH